MGTWISEFGRQYAIPLEILDRLAHGKLIDSSWPNDEWPSFQIPDAVCKGARGMERERPWNRSTRRLSYSDPRPAHPGR
jgi:hypothetical protein